MRTLGETRCPHSKGLGRTMSKQANSMIALLVFALAAPGLAEGPGPDGRGPGHPNPLKDRECVHECRREERACLKQVREDAAPCFQGCAALVEAAHQACDADPHSDACQAAAEAARA